MSGETREWLSRLLKQRLPRALKRLAMYALAPALCLVFLPEPVGRAVRGSETAAFLILLAALAAVCLNWAVYRALRGKRPSLPVYAHGVFCVLLFTAMEYLALPGNVSLSSTLALLGVCLGIAVMFLYSFWFASRRRKGEIALAVILWILIGILAAMMVFDVARDLESRTVDRETWITVAVLLAMIPAACSRKIHAACRRRANRRRAAGLTEGRIVQIVGETYLDPEEELATDYHARIQYEVDGAAYETRAPIAKLTWRRYGKSAFVGKPITVRYDPDDPARTDMKPIGGRFLREAKKAEKEKSAAGAAESSS